jgi:hypothetical protein
MTREEFLEIAASRYADLEKLKEHNNFYDYEKGFDELWIEMGREVLEKHLGALPKDHRKKTKLIRDTEK